MDRKRLIFSIASILLLLLFIMGSYRVLKNEKPYIPESTVSALDNERSQVYVSGEDYKLDNEVQKKHKETEQKRSKILEEKERENTQNSDRKRLTDTRKPKIPDDQRRPVTRPQKEPEQQKKPERVKPKDKDDGDDDEDDPDEREHYKKPEEERKLDPTVKTSLISGDKLKGENIDFTVTATDHQGNHIPAFSNGQGKIVVLVNGATVTSSGDSGGKVRYRVKAKNGNNSIKITAYDRKGRSRTITRKVTVDTNEEKEKTGIATVKVKAPSIGKPNIMSTTVEFSDGDTVEEVVKKALDKKGFSYNWPSGYLKSISKGGMISGWHISDGMMEYITERGAESKLVDHDKVNTGSLGENDIIKETGSGWCYSINGSFPDTGMQAKNADDGSVIELVFCLFSDRGDLNH